MSDTAPPTATEPAAAAPAAPRPRNHRKDLIGFVSSRSGDKTVKVTYAFKIAHPRYGKEVSRKTVVHAHDPDNSCAIGDKVEIMETRPLSKTKRFRIVRILEKAPLIGA